MPYHDFYTLSKMDKQKQGLSIRRETNVTWPNAIVKKHQ